MPIESTSYLCQSMQQLINDVRVPASVSQPVQEDEAGSRTSLQLIIYASTPIKPNYQSLFAQIIAE